MTLLAFGINHNTASLDVREKVAFAPERMTDALLQACRMESIEEAIILSTCNRTEIYAHLAMGEGGDYSADNVLRDWLTEFHQLAEADLSNAYYSYENDQAVGHIMRVASGLDSLVLGEPQILGQVKSAYALACDTGTVGKHLHSAFHQVFAVAKRIRSETAIGENPVSVAFAAVNLAQQIFSDLRQNTALLVGAGETIELVAQHLSRQNIGRVIVANRTLGRAAQLAEQLSAEAILLSDIPEQLHRADIVITSTASQLPLLGKGAVESALRQRRHQPIFMVDIAVPRDIEPQVGDLDDVYLYTVDDLRDVIDENLRSRQQAAKKAHSIVAEGVTRYQHDVRAQGSVTTIRAFREHAESLRDAELNKALKALQSGASAEVALQQLARGLTNKLLHTPTAKIKQAGAEGDSIVIESLHKLFDLPDESAQEDDSLP